MPPRVKMGRAKDGPSAKMKMEVRGGGFRNVSSVKTQCILEPII